MKAAYLNLLADSRAGGVMASSLPCTCGADEHSARVHAALDAGKEA